MSLMSISQPFSYVRFIHLYMFPRAPYTDCLWGATKHFLSNDWAEEVVKMTEMFYIRKWYFMYI